MPRMYSTSFSELEHIRWRMRTCPMCGGMTSIPKFYPATKKFLWIKAKPSRLVAVCWSCNAVVNIKPLYELLGDRPPNDNN